MQWKTARRATALALLLAATAISAAQSNKFAIDAGFSSVDAKVSFLGIGNRKALFPAVRGSVTLSPTKMDQIDLDVTIDATQLKADDKLTTSRLKGEDFFNVEKYPIVRFEGTQLAMSSATTGIVRGDLTARGVTRPVALNVTFSEAPVSASGMQPIRLTGVTTINRRDFGMTAYSMIVGKKVSITIRTRLLPA